ncbi:hypothetical protein Mapa_000916 [Marchantia paleacea]|nr:hypothetical protein Mapa_000916 [Marchantia paleacea]
MKVMTRAWTYRTTTLFALRILQSSSCFVLPEVLCNPRGEKTPHKSTGSCQHVTAKPI